MGTVVFHFSIPMVKAYCKLKGIDWDNCVFFWIIFFEIKLKYADA